MGLKSKVFSVGIVDKLNCMRYIKKVQLKFDASDELEMWKKHGKIARYDYIVELQNYENKCTSKEYREYCMEMYEKCDMGRIEKQCSTNMKMLIKCCCEKIFDNDFSQLYDKCIFQLRGIEATVLHIADWNMLELLFLYFRALRIAYVCREKKNELLINKKKNRRNPGFARWYALLEAGRYSEAKSEMEFMLSSTSQKKSGNIEFAVFLTSMITGSDVIEAKKHFLNTAENGNVTQRFANYVKDRNVLIVGPADEKKEGIDDAVIVRFTEFEPIDISNASYPAFTDISYYRCEYSEKMVKDNKKGSHLKYKVIRVGEGWDSSLIPNARPIMDFDYLFPSGTPNNVPNALLDLMRFDIKKIKVTGSNLFITNNIHEKGYIMPLHDDARGYLSTIHNYAENFVFMKILAEAGVYEPDSVLQNVLNMTTETYVAELEKTKYSGML